MAVGVTDIQRMFEYDEDFWNWFFVMHAFFSVCYGLVFYALYTNAEKKGETQNDCLLIATCSISTIHSHICCFGVVIGFFVDELYKPEYQIISPPGFMYVVCVSIPFCCDLVNE